MKNSMLWNSTIARKDHIVDSELLVASWGGGEAKYNIPKGS